MMERQSEGWSHGQGGLDGDDFLFESSRVFDLGFCSYEFLFKMTRYDNQGIYSPWDNTMNLQIPVPTSQA
jgi:hypothetical protein